MKVATFAPEENATEAGTVTNGLLLESATDVPPAGAGGLSLTVPVDVPPPTRLVGLMVREDTDTTEVPH